jgi:hypothetical protein
MEMTITSAAIATLISGLTSSIITMLISNKNKERGLDAQLDEILKIAIKYPYLESENLRYDVYGTLIFNFLARVSHHCHYNKKKIDQYIAIEDWVKLHSLYWSDPTSIVENIDSYNKEFVQLINSFVTKRKKSTK